MKGERLATLLRILDGRTFVTVFDNKVEYDLGISELSKISGLAVEVELMAYKNQDSNAFIQDVKFLNYNELAILIEERKI